MKSNFSSNFFITKHAVEQFVSRKHMKSEKDILFIIKRHINKQIFKLNEKTRSGEEKWLIPSLDCVLISKPEKNKNIVVTIIKNRTNVIANNNSSFEEKLINNLLKFDITSKNEK